LNKFDDLLAFFRKEGLLHAENQERIIPRLKKLCEDLGDDATGIIKGYYLCRKNSVKF
jgi:hypothetical protein